MKNKNAITQVFSAINADHQKAVQDMAELYLLVAEGQPIDQIIEIIRAQSQNLTVMSTVKISARTAA
jgi:hypothetical protein